MKYQSSIITINLLSLINKYLTILKKLVLKLDNILAHIAQHLQSFIQLIQIRALPDRHLDQYLLVFYAVPQTDVHHHQLRGSRLAVQVQSLFYLRLFFLFFLFFAHRGLFMRVYRATGGTVFAGFGGR